MPYPKHPDTIIVKNEFYPNGLKEIDIWNHYQRAKVKNSILAEIKGRPVIVVLIIDGTRIVRRFPVAPPYDKMITGRTISVHTTIKARDTFFVVDIDAGKNVTFSDVKKATAEVYKVMVKNLGATEIRFTGSGFHLIHNSGKVRPVEKNKEILRSILLSNFEGKYLVAAVTAPPNQINLDLAPMKRLGGHICRYSLAENGLICLPVSISKLTSFSKQEAIFRP